ncbi:MAG TPA: sulfur transferase domain-containing protein [Lysobacter sp.]
MTAPVRFADALYAAGQPTSAHLAGLAREGVRTVINLRGVDEPCEYDEAAEAARLGMRYLTLPIAGPADVDRERVRRFGALLDEARGDGGVLIHCATSNRVGAMVALDQALNRGCDLAGALEHGRSAGLATLEPVVVALAEREGAPR